MLENHLSHFIIEWTLSRLGNLYPKNAFAFVVTENGNDLDFLREL